MTLFSELLLFLCTLLFGGIVGAYFTTADYRIRNNLPLITSQCYCPACGHILALTHQIPTLKTAIDSINVASTSTEPRL